MDDLGFLDFASGVEIPVVVLLSTVFLLFNIFLFRRAYYGVADPMFLFIVFNSFALVATFFVTLAKNKYYYIFDLFIFNVAFFLVALLGRSVPNQADLRRAMQCVCRREADVFVFVLAGVTLFASVVFWSSVGIPFFAENPSEAKVLYYEGGFGGVKYVQIISPPVICLYAMLNLVRRRIAVARSRSMKLYIVFSVIIAGSIGSKAGLLFLVFSSGYIMYFVRSRKVRNIFRRIMFVFFGVALVLVAAVLAATPQGVLDGFALRLFASGDIFFFWYFYDLQNILSGWHPLDFIGYLISPVLGMVKLVEQDYPVGAYVLNEALGYPLSGFGPNAQLPVVLRMYFSDSYYLGGIFFGWLLCFIRSKGHFLMKKIGIVGFYFYVTLFFNATFIFVDINYYFSLIGASLVVVIPVGAISAAYLYAVGYRGSRPRLRVDFL